MNLHRSFLIALLLFTSACSTVLEGRSETIIINSAPQGAFCLLKQADDVVGRITTPGSAVVRKTKNDLVILCSKEGYEAVSVNNHSSMALTTLGNAVLYDFSFVGNAIDAASGANNKYDSTVFVRLVPAAAPRPFPAPPGAPTIQQLPMGSLVGMTMQAPMPLASINPSVVTPIAISSNNPALSAAAALGKASLSVPAHEQVVQLSYAQEMTQASQRPPFEITQ